MIILNEKEITEIYGIKDALKDIEKMLHQKAKGEIVNPHRTVIEYPKEDGSVLYMPSTDLSEQLMSLKAVTIFPNNPLQGKDTTQGVTLISDAKNGDHVAMFNASYLTRLRTGAISGLATARLALENAKVLSVIGTGAMAFEQVLGVLAVRSIEQILLFNPTKEKAERFKERLRSFGIDESIEIKLIDDVSKAVSNAHIICCSTRSNTPVFDGKDIQPGTHVNGVGSYLPHMREVDLTFIKRADKIVLDDLEGVKGEAGELIHAANNGWTFNEAHGELVDLVTGNISHRETADEITFFKSVGAAYYDLAVSNGVYKKALKRGIGTVMEV